MDAVACLRAENLFLDVFDKFFIKIVIPFDKIATSAAYRRYELVVF